MDKNQKINCSVENCKFHDEENHICALDAITVEAFDEYSTGEPEDESMCGSYEINEVKD